MGKLGKKQLNVKDFELIGGGFIVAAYSGRYAVAYKERNNSAGWKVWVLEGHHPILSYNESGYRLRDQTCDLARRFSSAMEAEITKLRQCGNVNLTEAEYMRLRVENLTSLVPEGLRRLVEQCWKERDKFYRQYHQIDDIDHLAVTMEPALA